MDFKSQLKALRKKTGSESFAESKFASDEEFVSTGNYALNRILSGSVYNGIPAGRLTLLNGESMTGKSYIATKCIKSAMENKNFVHAFYVDTEGGSLYKLMVSMGIDLTKVEHVLVENAEDSIITCLNILKTIKEFQENNPDARFIIVFDSLGAVRAFKLFTDALDKGVNKTDMGITARKIGDLIIGMTIPALKTKTPVLLLNHVYDDPSAMHPSKIKNFGGGKKARFMPRVVVQCTHKFEKETPSGAQDKNAFFQGNALSFFTCKTNNVRPFLNCTMTNNFLEVDDPFDGLFEVAVGYKLIEQSGPRYKVPLYSGDKSWFKKELLNDKKVKDEMWKILLPLVDEKSKKDLAFTSEEYVIEEPTEEDLKELKTSTEKE